MLKQRPNASHIFFITVSLHRFYSGIRELIDLHYDCFVITSVVDRGCLSRIHYQGSNFFPSRIRIKEFTYLNSRNGFLALFFIPNLGSGAFYPSLIPYPGVKKAPDPGSATLVLPAVCFNFNLLKPIKKIRE